MIKSARLKRSGFKPLRFTPPARVSAVYNKASPHRLEAQDATLSRSKLEFESPWGHKEKPILLCAMGFSFSGSSPEADI
jgi:hypothetical protein